ncbi:unnamed protein product [Angiostrongylus costaricensis]|uniref:PQ-loop repeat-containing protein 1 n=1 Tax=Angiostrongylus costaricensis TaxID=334426 RepID=A0A3P7H5M3_ANGCS|nr:unnamed protein product [Angiostrongylus costaricensis]
MIRNPYLFSVGGSIPYVFQYVEIHHRRNAQGFSLFVCLALCIANILRILFWFGKRFDLALLAQSIVMFICMVFMLEISVRMNRKHTPKSQYKSILSKYSLLEVPSIEFQDTLLPQNRTFLCTAVLFCFVFLFFFTFLPRKTNANA